MASSLRAGQSLSLDFIGILILAHVCILSQVLLWHIYGFSVFLIVIIGFVRDGWKTSVRPFWKSTIAPEELANDPKLVGLNVRISRHYTTHVFRLMFRTYLLVNEQDFQKGKAVWPAMAAHERAHIKSGDVTYFTLLSNIGDIAGLYLVGVIGHFLLVLRHDIENPVHWSAMPIAIVIMIVVLVPLFNIIRHSLYDREYAADRYAHNLEPDATEKWLRRAANREATRTWLRHAKSGAWFSHPSFKKRLAALHSEQTPNQAVTSLALQAIYVLCVTVILSALFFATQASSDPPFVPSWLTILGATSAVLTAIAGFGYTSYAAQRAMHARHLIGGATFALSFSIFLTLPAVAVLVATNYTNIAITYLAADQRVGVVQILQASLFLFATTLTCAGLLTAANRVIMPLTRFKTLFHLVAGPACFALGCIVVREAYRLMLWVG